MIKWYEGNNLVIFFSERPHLAVRCVLPSMSDVEKKDIRKKPFISKRDLVVFVYDYIEGRRYCFSIPKGYCWDGATIPRIFWRLVGSKSDPQFLVASCLHDYMLEHKGVIRYKRKLTSRIFQACLLEAGVSDFKARIMTECVDFYQRFCNWERGK